jgi:hypothetical protein
VGLPNFGGARLPSYVPCRQSPRSSEFPRCVASKRAPSRAQGEAANWWRILGTARPASRHITTWRLNYCGPLLIRGVFPEPRPTSRNGKIETLETRCYPILNCRCSRQRINIRNKPVKPLITIESNRKILMVWPKTNFSGPKNTLRCFDV